MFIIAGGGFMVMAWLGFLRLMPGGGFSGGGEDDFTMTIPFF